MQTALSELHRYCKSQYTTVYRSLRQPGGTLGAPGRNALLSKTGSVTGIRKSKPSPERFLVGVIFPGGAVTGELQRLRLLSNQKSAFVNRGVLQLDVAVFGDADLFRYFASVAVPLTLNLPACTEMASWGCAPPSETR